MRVKCEENSRFAAGLIGEELEDGAELGFDAGVEGGFGIGGGRAEQGRLLAGHRLGGDDGGGGTARGFGRGGLGLGLDVFAGAFDGEAFLVEEVLDLEDRFDILAAVHAMVGAHLAGGDGGEFGFPIAEDVLLEAGELGDFADAEVELGGKLVGRADPGGEIGGVEAEKVFG